MANSKSNETKIEEMMISVIVNDFELLPLGGESSAQDLEADEVGGGDEMSSPAQEGAENVKVAPRYVGYLNGFDGYRVVGWFKQHGSDDAMAVDIYVNGEPVATDVLADCFRADLQLAGFGTGCHGLDYMIESEVFDPGTEVRVSVRAAGGTTDIVSKSFTGPFGEWHAYINSLAGRNVRGWVKSRKNNEVCQIDIYLNEHLVAADVTADQLRPDVRDAGFADGRFGFDFSITGAPHIEGDTVTLSVRVAGTDRVIVSREFANEVFKDSYRYHIDRVDVENIRGWCVNRNRNDEIFSIKLFVNDLFYNEIRNDILRGDLKKAGVSGGAGGFSLKNPMRFMGGGVHRLYFVFPDGTRSSVYEIKGIQDVRPAPILIPNLASANVTVIVPIYNAAEDVEICIERLLKYTLEFANILLIDDCSPDGAIREIFARYEGHPRLRLLRNETNLGYTRTVNRGIDESGKDDVVLLNSDARVTPGWLEGLLAAASSSPRVATVTAMSDRAGAFSAPRIGNENVLPEGVDEAVFARAFRRRSAGLYPRVPTGNGFCMYVSRQCIDGIGAFDAEAFPRGYGEENDFCMRALREGWRHVMDDRTYVYHERSKSFGSHKGELLAAGRAVVDQRFPEYKNAIGIFNSDERIAASRFLGALALKECVDTGTLLPRILFVASTRTGGTPQTNLDLMMSLSGFAECWVLYCDSKTLELNRLVDGQLVVETTHTLKDPVDAVSHRSPEYDAVVAGWLFSFDFDLVHIRHLAWHSLSLPSIAKRLAKKVVFSFHDYYALTPTIKLLDDAGVFLGKTYLPEGSNFRESLWPVGALPHPSEQWLMRWRERFERELGVCDAFVTTSPSTRNLLLENLTRLDADRFFVIPHGRDFPSFGRIRQAPVHGEPLRILVPGNITAAKGLDVLYGLLEYDLAGLLEFHVLGNVQMTGWKNHPRVIRHGSYARADFAKKAAAVRPHVGAIFSIWDETYCHTLTELWSVGVPAIVFEFPTLAQRVRQCGGGWVMDHKDIAKLYEEILSTAYDEREQSRVDQALAVWQSGYGASNTAAMMATGYIDIYRCLLSGGTADIEKSRSPRFAAVCAPLTKGASRRPTGAARIAERAVNRAERGLTFVHMAAENMMAAIREKSIDGVIVQGRAIPRTMVVNFLATAAEAGIPFLLDIDDELVDAIERDAKGGALDYAIALNKMMTQATALTVSSERLAHMFGGVNPTLYVVPDRLDNRLWRPAPPGRANDGKVRALWVGREGQRDLLEAMLPDFDAVAEADPDFRLRLAGIALDGEAAKMRAEWLEQVALPSGGDEKLAPWLRAAAAECDFAIMPLAEDSDVRAAPLGIPALAAASLPVLVSEVDGVSTDAPGVRFAGREEGGWYYALRGLINECAANASGLRASQRRWALNTQMLEDGFPAFDAILTAMIAGDPPA